MKEGPFNLRLQKSIKALGIFCYKTADRFHPGVPDLYICGGNWIESKVVKVGKQNRPIDLAGRMTEAQHNFARDLIKGGDRVLFCARVETPFKKHLFLVPYQELVYREWYVGDLIIAPEIKSEKLYDVTHYFSKEWNCNLNPEWFQWENNHGL